MKSTLDEAEDRISELEDKVQKNTQKEQEKKKNSKRMLTEKQATQVSDTEFKAMVIRKLTELSELKENYQKRRGNYNDSLQTIST